MKKIAIALFTVVALSSCGGGEQKCEGENCADSCAVVAPATDTTKVDTTATK